MPPSALPPPPLRLATAIASSTLLAILLALSLDLNGNILLPNPLPDILNPAPTLLCLSSLVAACLLALLRTLRYPTRRTLWITLTAILLLLLIASLYPALL